MSNYTLTHGVEWSDVVLPFLSLLFQAIPFLLIGSLLSAFLEKTLPFGAIPVFSQKIGKLRYLFFAALGIIFPVCECAAVPVARMLHRNGLPISCCIIFLLASPTINPLTLLSTLAAFQNQQPLLTTTLRALCVFLLALSAGTLTAFHKHKDIIKPLPPQNPFQFKLHQHPASWNEVLTRAITEFFDMACYLVMGAAMAALLTSGVNRVLLYHLGEFPNLGIIVMMGASFTLSLCSSSDAFIVAPLVGIPWAAKMAFLILGPLIDIKLLFLYSSFLKKTFLLKIVLLTAGGTFGICYMMAHYLFIS